MSGFLLDTDVISLLSPSRTEATAPFLGWLQRMDEEGRIFLSVVSVHEIEKGIVMLEQKTAVARATALRSWITGLTAAFAERILGLDADTAVASGRLEALATSQGVNAGMADAMIAGIAQVHELTVVTGNAKHFRHFGVPVLMPVDVAIESQGR